MVRRTLHLALVVLAVLVATGPSALVLAATPGSAAVAPVGATADTDSGMAADSGVTAAVRPLDELDDVTTDENLTTDGNLTDDENLTDDSNDDGTTDENLTDDETSNETLTNTSDDLAETTAVVNETTEMVANETGDATDLTNATTELDGAVADGANATNVTDDVDDAADAVETIDAATGDVMTVSAERILFELAGSPLLSVDAAEAVDPSGEDGDADDAESDGGPASGAPGDSDPATERGDGTETTTAAGTGEAGTTAVGASDAESAASETDSDGSSDPHSGAPPSGTEAVASVGALTAVALFPHLADGLSLAGDAGALSAASSTAASSRSLVPPQGEVDKVWRTATAFRYSRYDDSDPLAHETRAELHETVERSPGAYLSQVCERADVAVSTARHHLDVLEEEGLVTAAKVRGKRRYFPAHSDDVELAAALEDEAAAEVLRALARLGDSHGGRLADELDRDPSTVSHHLSRLEDAGLVEREREGRAVVNRLAPGVERVLGNEEIEGDGEAGAEAPAIAD